MHVLNIWADRHMSFIWLPDREAEFIQTSNHCGQRQPRTCLNTRTQLMAAFPRSRAYASSSKTTPALCSVCPALAWQARFLWVAWVSEKSEGHGRIDWSDGESNVFANCCAPWSALNYWFCVGLRCILILSYQNNIKHMNWAWSPKFVF